MNLPFKVYKALSGVGKPYKLWGPVDLESDEDSLKLGRDPRVCTSSIFPGVLETHKSSRAFERERRRDDGGRDMKRVKIGQEEGTDTAHHCCVAKEKKHCPSLEV